ncbi:MAG: TauD/TfdA family dioxygenase [Proteobacteria bacterium]|nr:TauD/TfdA family dioxygenase [Pseudomonadota bacterium]
MNIKPTGKALGAIVTGIDLSKDVSEADRAILYDAYIENMILVFPEQTLDYGDLLRLREVFGPAGKTVNQLLNLECKKHYAAEVPDGITIISNVLERSGLKRLPGLDGEAFWHTDSSFTEVPISASLLYGAEVTEVGGETGFLNMARAYEEMPEDLRRRVDGQYANHSKVHTSEGRIRQEFAEVTDPSQAPGVKHPMVRVHPVTGKKCLYLGRRLYSYIFGLELEESEEVLDEIWAYTCQEKFVYEHKWDRGDLVVWDNRCTMHHRNSFPEEMRRVMHKSITGGEAVIAA